MASAPQMSAFDPKRLARSAPLSAMTLGKRQLQSVLKSDRCAVASPTG